MKISLNCDTSNMTKEERLAVRSQLQAALSQLNHELNTGSKAQHLSFAPSEAGPSYIEGELPTNFVGVAPDLANISDADLETLRKEGSQLLSQIMHHINLRKKD